GPATPPRPGHDPGLRPRGRAATAGTGGAAGPDRAGLVRVLHRPGRARGEVRGRRVLAASPRSGRRLRAVRWCGMSWLTRAPREPSAAERAAIQAETCTACRRDDGAAMVLI